MNKYDILFEVIKNNTEATPIRIMAYLIDNMDENFEVQAPFTEIAKFVGRCDRNISRYIRKFTEDGLMSIKKNGRYNVYCLNIGRDKKTEM